MKIVSSLLKLSSGSDQNPYPSKSESAPDSVELWDALFSHFGGVRSPQPFRRFGSPLSASPETAIFRCPSRRKANQALSSNE